ncbi:MAG TPA: response regulator [Bacteroidales bacterium]|nr:response regulator [Bacteroidales bacterium]
MARKDKPDTTPQSELMTRRIRKKILLPVGLSSLFTIISVAAAIAGMILLPVITGIITIITLFVSIIELRKLIADTRAIMRELSFIAERHEEVINSFSHKIREPLNNLVLLSGMLRDSSAPGKQQELVETFVASTDAMVEVVNDLTMETAGNATFESRSDIRFKLGPTIRDTIELLKLNRRHEHSMIFYDDKGEGETELRGNPIILKQILIDLLSTAISAATGNLTVKIEARETPQRDGAHLIEFTLSTNHPVVFVGEERQPHTLAIKLITTSGGSWQEHSTGSGSYFVFTIRLQKYKRVERAEAASTLIKGITKESGKKKMKDVSILLVEDNPINQRITQLMLEPLVRRIEIARNGKEALDMFGTSRYDLILMDIRMPVMNGLVSAEKIRALETSTQSHTPIIAITANAMLGDREQCLAVGMDDYISKPIDPEQLIEKISALI